MPGRERIESLACRGEASLSGVVLRQLLSSFLAAGARLRGDTRLPHFRVVILFRFGIALLLLPTPKWLHRFLPIPSAGRANREAEIWPVRILFRPRRTFWRRSNFGRAPGG